MNMDSWAHRVSILKDVFLAFTPIITLIIAWLGIHTFQRQQIWLARLKMATRLMRLMREYQARLGAFRLPVGGPEGEDRKKALEQLEKILRTMSWLSWESEVLFDIDFRPGMESLLTSFEELVLANSLHSKPGLFSRQPPDEKKKLLRTLFSDPDGDDLGTLVEETIGGLKGELRRAVSVKS